MSNDAVETYAAVDLGSNSFHMIVASYGRDHLQVIDRIKKMVRLASGLDDNDNLTEESMRTALECLQEFGQRIREIPQLNVRAVGTNTLRRANNGRRFIREARQALGHSIDIIAGREEARLIYLGVAHTVFDDSANRLVVDIGGGSTEIILGKGFDIHRLDSFYMGCVSMNRQFFADGQISKKAMNNAILAVRQELEPVEATYKRTGWTRVIGSSGTILAVQAIVTAKGWSSNGITRDALRRLREEVIRCGSVAKLNLPGLTPNRQPVFIGGLAVLCGIFETFGVEVIEVSDGALREGLLYDLIGRLHDRDIRDSTIARMAQRYDVDTGQGNRVMNTALMLYDQVAPDWGLNDQTDGKFLEWAASVHEIGLAVAYPQYHRHGAYLIANSDMPGFSREEQGRLAMLIRCHRRKYPLPELAILTAEEREWTARLTTILRLAILLNRSRSDTSLPEIRATAGKTSLRLSFPEGWLDSNPLTRTDLDQEAGYVKGVGLTLEYNGS